MKKKKVQLLKKLPFDRPTVELVNFYVPTFDGERYMNKDNGNSTACSLQTPIYYEREKLTAPPKLAATFITSIIRLPRCHPVVQSVPRCLLTKKATTLK